MPVLSLLIPGGVGGNSVEKSLTWILESLPNLSSSDSPLYHWRASKCYILGSLATVWRTKKKKVKIRLGLLLKCVSTYRKAGQQSQLWSPPTFVKQHFWGSTSRGTFLVMYADDQVQIPLNWWWDFILVNLLEAEYAFSTFNLLNFIPCLAYLKRVQNVLAYSWAKLSNTKPLL